MPSVVSACAAPRTQPRAGCRRTRGRRWRGRTRGASCPSSVRSAPRCRARARRRRGRCRCRTRAGSCRRARRGRCARAPGARRGRGRRRCARSAPRGRRRRRGGRWRSRPRPAGSGRTDRRSATGAGRRRRSRSGPRATRRRRAFHSANGAAVARSTSSRVANRRSSSSSPVASARAKWSRCAERLRGLVAQAGQLADPVGDLGTDLLRRLPRRAALVGVVAGAEDLGDGVVVDALGRRSSPRKLLNVDSTRGLELDDGPAQVGRHLVGHEAVVQHVELAAEQRVVAARHRVARRRGPRRSASGRRGTRGGRARPRCGARRPPATTGCSTPTTPRPARPRAVAAGLRGRRRGSAGDRAVSPARGDRSRSGSLRTRRPRPRARRGRGGRAARRPSGPRTRSAASPPGHGLVVGREQAPGAVDLLGRRRERPVGQRDLGRVDAELAPVAERRGPRRRRRGSGPRRRAG